MLQVNKLIHDVHEALGLTGLGESTPGELSVVGVRELNQLISTLNSQGYLALAQKFVDMPAGSDFYIKELQVDYNHNKEQVDGNVIDMLPPETVEAVSRKVGTRWIPMYSLDLVTMSQKNPMTIATSWTYSREFETVPEINDHGTITREVGHIHLDGIAPYGVRIFYTSKLPTYTLDDTIYLSDLYNELLISGLKYRLADFHCLDDKKASAETEFTGAKTLIKRNNITQRMMQSGPVGGSWEDTYYDGIAGTGW